MDKIDIIGPNKTVKNIIDDFKFKYNVEIYYINYKDFTLASPIDGDNDSHKTIESLLKEKNVKYKDNSKYFKLGVTGSLDDVEINNPTIRYILKCDKIGHI